MFAVFYKPCSVLCFSREKKQSGNHLSAVILPFCPVLLPDKKRPYHCLGCSLEGFTAFHHFDFSKCFVTVALSRILRHRLLLSLFFCRYFKRSTLAYGFAKHEHYRHLSLCEHGLSSACLVQTAITQKLHHSNLKLTSFLNIALILSIALTKIRRSCLV